ncbi:hypothetical protein [Clostridium niameyense]|uniref:hypothetical protein n=1 Tax=Clostridium niameyense TaxID=1622073 RepID=UPI0013D81C35|nr:hypothetical protein [Clostridium niameyense]
MSNLFQVNLESIILEVKISDKIDFEKDIEIEEYISRKLYKKVFTIYYLIFFKLNQYQ